MEPGEVTLYAAAISAASGLVGAVVGGGLTWLAQSAERRARQHEERSSLAHAIAAEIDAYLDIVEKRDHLSYARQLLEANRKGDKRVPKNWLSPFEKAHSPFRLLEANLSRIGILGGICREIATFYARVMAVRVTLIAADEGAYDDATPKDLAFILENEIELWESADKLGKAIVADLRKLAD